MRFHPLLFKVPTPWPSLPPFFKSLLPLPFFLFHPLLRYFRQFPPPSHNPLLPLPNTPTSLYIINRFKQISKRCFYQFNCCFLSNIFDFLNPFTNISGYLNLWDIFRFILRQLRMTFLHKIMVPDYGMLLLSVFKKLRTWQFWR